LWHQFDLRPAARTVAMALKSGYMLRIVASNRGDLHDYRIFADRAPASDAFAGRRIRQIEAVFARFDRGIPPDPQSFP